MRRWEAQHRCTEITCSGYEWICTSDQARVVNSTAVSTGTFQSCYRHWRNHLWKRQSCTQTWTSPQWCSALSLVQLFATCGWPSYKSQNPHSLNTNRLTNSYGADRCVMRCLKRRWLWIGGLLKTKQITFLRWNCGNSLKMKCISCRHTNHCPLFLQLKS